MKFRRTEVVQAWEKDMADVVQNLKPPAVQEYAPPSHADRITASAKIMCDGIDKLFASASEDNQKVVDQAEAALNDMKRFKDMVDTGMREAADGLKKHLCHVMSLLEDGTSKMQQNPFNGDIPKLLEQGDGQAQKE